MNIRIKRAWNTIGGTRTALLAGLALLILFQGGDVSAAEEVNSLTIAKSGTGLGGDFDKELKVLATGTVKAMHALLVVMTAIAGMMVVFGLEDGKKLVWQLMLGAGLAMNFGAFLLDAGFWEKAAETTATAMQPFVPDIQTGEGAKVSDFNVLSKFVQHYKENVITPGAANIMPYCVRLLVILTLLQATWDLTMKFMSGDKMQYLINMTLKLGFFVFLMKQWITLMTALKDGFQTLGMKAAGVTDSGGDLISIASDKIFATGIRITSAILAPNTTKLQDKAAAGGDVGMWDRLTASVGDTFLHMTGAHTLIAIIVVVVLLICFLIVCLEITMASVEFYTMALLTIPCLAFGTMGKFSFLTERAIGAVFNCAMKVCVIGFIALFAQTYLDGMAKKILDAEGLAENLAILLQTVLATLLIALLTKKIPQLASGLLNGSPQLSGSDMTGTLRAGVAGAAGGAGQVVAARAAAAAAGGGKATMMGTLTQLARHNVRSNGPLKNYREAFKAVEHTTERTKKMASTIDRNTNFKPDDTDK